VVLDLGIREDLPFQPRPMPLVRPPWGLPQGERARSIGALCFHIKLKVTFGAFSSQPIGFFRFAGKKRGFCRL